MLGQFMPRYGKLGQVTSGSHVR